MKTRDETFHITLDPGSRNDNTSHDSQYLSLEERIDPIHNGCNKQHLITNGITCQKLEHEQKWLINLTE